MPEDKKSEGREEASHRLTVNWERKPMTEMLMSADGHLACTSTLLGGTRDL